MNPQLVPVSARGVRITLAMALLATIPSTPLLAQDARARSGNEAEAVAALRSIAAAQEAFKAAAYIDTNCDGVGEYGYFAELAGTVPMRVAVGNPCQPGAGSPADILNPPLLPSEFGHVRHRCVAHDGYFFEMFLPMPSAGGAVGGNSEDATGGKTQAPFSDPGNGAGLWCCYAWPMRYLESGRRAFFINQRGFVLVDQNRMSSPYASLWGMPSFDCAYSSRDMRSPLNIWGVDPNGHLWRPLN